MWSPTANVWAHLFPSATRTLKPCPAREEDCWGEVDVCPVLARAGLIFYSGRFGAISHLWKVQSKRWTHPFRAGKNGVMGKSWLILSGFFVLYLVMLLLLLSFSSLIVLSSKLFLSGPVIPAFCLPGMGGKGSTICPGRFSVERKVTNLESVPANPPLGVFRSATELRRKALDLIKYKS